MKASSKLKVWNSERPPTSTNENYKLDIRNLNKALDQKFRDFDLKGVDHILKTMKREEIYLNSSNYFTLINGN